jgi:AraC-like DNA-binding protein
MNKNVYQDKESNSLRISEYKKYAGESTFSNVAAKFVVKGSETYIIRGNKFVVNEGEYILGNNNEMSEVNIDKNTIGLCIDISNDVITEIIESVFDNPDLNEFMLTDKFFINKYNSQHTHLGHRLNRLSKTLLQENRDVLLTTELFYSVGENIVHDQSIIFEQFSRLHYKKQNVNEEVFRNLLNAKHYIEENFLHAIDLNELSKISLISKYALIRLYKNTFGSTPYQYILQKRLLHARQLILSGKKIADVADTCGFADSATFSKAFKNHFRLSPSKLV